MCPWREMAQAGCLLTFGTNLEWVFGRVVDYLVRPFAPERLRQSLAAFA